MSLSKKDLIAIQKAGHAVHDAAETISVAIQSQAQSMVSNLTSKPFGAELNQVVERFKSLSALGQGLVAIEAEMQKLYAAAQDLASPAADVIIVAPVGRRRALANSAAVDVIVKRAKAGGRKPATPGNLTGNDAKLLAFLQSALKSGKETKISGEEMVKGSTLPTGSIGSSMKKLAATGLVKTVGRGIYQLGAAAPAQAPEEEKKKRAPAAKKATPAKAPALAKKAAKPKATRKVKAKEPKGGAAEAPAVAEGAPGETAPV